MASKQAVNACEEMDLGGGNVIAGVLIHSRNKKVSIYQALMRGILTQGTALVLLEAQAAIGFLIDPVKNKKVPVRDAIAAGLTGAHYYGKLLSAEKAVTGYTDPYTGNKISLFQAMKKDLIFKDHGIRLLEAQIATGGIIDPVHSHRVPVEVAYKRGYFDEELNRILSDPQKYSKSCFDPNTHENLTYMQLLSRCVPDPDTGLLMLQLMDKGSVLFQLDEQMRISLQSAPATVSVGLFQGQNVTVWELLFSRYVPEHKRQELLKKYKAGTLTIQEMTTIITTIVTETEEKSSRELRPVKSPSRQGAPSQKAEAALSQRDEKWEKALKSTTVDGPVGEFQGRKVSVWELLFSKYVPEEKRQELLKKYEAGTLTVHEMITILTTIVTEAEERSSKCPATRKTPSKETTASEKAKDAPSHEGQQLEKTLKATLVEVPAGEFHGRKVSVWDLLLSKYIPEEKQKELLELYRAGILSTDQMKTIVTGIVTKTEEESHRRPGHGEGPGTETATSEKAEAPHSPHDKHLENALRSEAVDVPVGEFKGQEVSLWELLFSSYISETKRQELLKKYRAGTLTIREMITIITTIITETEEKSGKHPGGVEDPCREERAPQGAATAPPPQDEQAEKTLRSATVDVSVGEFQGRKVSVWELLFSKYIPEEKRQELLKKYEAGTLTIHEMITILTAIVTEAEERSSKRPATRKTPSKETTASEKAKDAPSREGQQLEKTLKATLVEVPAGEFHGRKVSVWVLLLSKYIPEEKRKELLELYRAGILSIDQMKTIVTGIVTKTEEERHHRPGHGEGPGTETATSEKAEAPHSPHDKHLENALRSEAVDVPVGEFKGQEVSLWELLFSSYISETKRQELLKKYRAGTLTIREMITIITTVITERETGTSNLHTNTTAPSKALVTSDEAEGACSHELHLRKSLKTVTICVTAGELQGQKVSLLDLLFSQYIPQEKRQKLLELYRTGIITREQMIPIITRIIEKTEAASRKLMESVKSRKRKDITSEEAVAAHSPQDADVDNILKSTTIDGPLSDFHGQKASVWDLLFSKYIPEEKQQEILELYREGILSLDQVITIVTTIIKKKEATSRKFVVNVKTPSKDIMTSEQAEAIHLEEDHQSEKTLKSTVVDVPVGEFHEQKASVWDLLFSKYIPEEKRQEILELYREGILSLDQVITVVTTIAKKKEATSRKFVVNVKTPSKDIMTSEQAETIHLEEDHQPEKTLKSTVVDVPVGEFHEQKASVWDLLFSKYIPEEKQQEILELYREGILSLDQVITVVTTIAKKKEATSRKFVVNVKSPSKDIVTSEQAEAIHLEEDHQLEKTLKSTVVYIPVGGFHEQKASIWDLLFSKYISKETRQELLKEYRAGTLATDKLKTILTTIITYALEECFNPNNQQILHLLQSEASYVTVGQFQDQRVSVWELLSSKRISQYNREAHLDTYNTGGLTINEVTITTTVITGSEGKKEDCQ